MTNEEREQKRIQRKKVARRKKETLALLVMLCTVLAKESVDAHMEVSKGKNLITTSYATQCLKHVGTTSGFNFIIEGKQVSYDEAISYLKREGHSNGFSDTEIYIALDKYYNSNVASSAYEDISKEDVKSAALTAYYENKLEEVNSNGRK